MDDSLSLSSLSLVASCQRGEGEGGRKGGREEFYIRLSMTYITYQRYDIIIAFVLVTTPVCVSAYTCTYMYITALTCKRELRGKYP